MCPRKERKEMKKDYLKLVKLWISYPDWQAWANNTERGVRSGSVPCLSLIRSFLETSTSGNINMLNLGVGIEILRPSQR